MQDARASSISEEDWRSEQCVADAIKIKVLQVFEGLEALVDRDDERGRPETRYTPVVLYSTSRTPPCTHGQHCDPSNAKWSELKRMRANKSIRRQAEHASPDNHIMPSENQLEATANNYTKVRYRPRRKTPPIYADFVPHGDKPLLQRVDDQEAALRTAHHADPTESAAGPRDSPAPQANPRVEHIDASALRARRVRFAAQLEEDPPAALHSPRTAKAGGRGACAARMLRAISRSFTRALRRAPG
jgi:hypothetical protein